LSERLGQVADAKGLTNMTTQRIFAMTDLAKLERERMLAAEQAVIASIPKEMMQRLNEADAKFKAEGGCKGCGSTSIGVHYMPCSVSADDLY
jgi:hypothetical protein